GRSDDERGGAAFGVDEEEVEFVVGSECAWAEGAECEKKRHEGTEARTHEVVREGRRDEVRTSHSFSYSPVPTSYLCAFVPSCLIPIHHTGDCISRDSNRYACNHSTIR